jgi:hypothetical protein
MKHITVTLTLGVPCWKEDEDNIQDVLDALKAVIELESAMLVLSISEAKALSPFHIEGSEGGRFSSVDIGKAEAETTGFTVGVLDPELRPFWWLRRKRVLRGYPCG